ncbi:TRAP-type C4-dicarboxylate transport system permease small subunit [Chelatococcus caeni]|uniref:TRAP transporter small permease protein n=1 Tax=Chelatococcus caeni TaxID=1348468 RepID=A0A840BZF5_9HYPH|nr:TRAP transporter small permease [Chelatococcus caeni]MBB4016669.1 TRAP-type C4-dicarboxylate transport system permease small subunit [Chelatococcus caeni]
MTSILTSLHRLLRVLSTAALWLSAAGLVAMTAAVAWQVFGRYVLNDTPSWTEPISLLLMSWFILLGAAVGVRENFHLGLDIVRFFAPDRVARFMDGVSLVAITGFGIAMAWFGWTLVVGTWSATLPVLGIPGGIDYLPLVVGGGLIALFAVERLVGMIAHPREDIVVAKTAADLEAH